MQDLAKFQSRDEDCFRQVMLEYSSLVLMVCQSFATDFDHAQDLFQETWIRVYERASTFEGHGSMHGWVHRIATNVCVSDFRARRTATTAMTRYLAESRSLAAAWRKVDPLFDTEQRELERAIHRVLGELSEGELQAVTLRLFENRTPRETAEMMGVAPATVRSHLRHALNRLRRIMEDPDSELSRYRSDH